MALRSQGDPISINRWILANALFSNWFDAECRERGSGGPAPVAPVQKRIMWSQLDCPLRAALEPVATTLE